MYSEKKGLPVADDARPRRALWITREEADVLFRALREAAPAVSGGAVERLLSRVAAATLPEAGGSPRACDRSQKALDCAG